MRWTIWPALAFVIPYAIILGWLDPFGVTPMPHPVVAFFLVWGAIILGVWLWQKRGADER